MMKDTRLNFPSLCALFGIFLSLCTAPLPVSAEGPKAETVAIVPFEIHASKDLSYLRDGIRDMLASRLAKGAGVNIISKAKVDEVAGMGPILPGQFQAVSEKLGADYLVVGSYTSLGGGASIDAKVYSAAVRTAQDFFATAPGEADVIAAINNLSRDIGANVFGVTSSSQPSVAAASSAPAPQAPQPAPVYQTAHPERAFFGNSAAGSPFIRPGGITGAFGFTKSQNFNLNLQAMDVGDIDGDGIDDVVLADRQSVKVYRVSDGRFTLMGEVATLPRYKIHYVSLADLNNNGRNEIYVSCNENVTPNAFAVEWQGEAFGYLFQDQRYYIRAMEVPADGMVIAGQKGTMDEPFEPGIFKLEAENGQLRKTEKIPVPDKVNIFDFVLLDLEADGRTEVVAIDQSDKLSVLRQSGKQLWKSSDYYGGTTRYVGEAEFERSAGQVERYYVPSRLIVLDLNNDQLPDVVVNKNLSAASRVFSNLKSYPNGEIHGMAWNGIALAQLWRTSQIDGYIADYQLKKIDDSGKAILYVGVILTSGVNEILSATESTVLMYPLDLRTEEKPNQ